MNGEQEQFFNFILDRTREDNISEAKELLENNFKKQAEGTYTKGDAMSFIANVIPLLRPEKVEEVKTVMTGFARSIGS